MMDCRICEKQHKIMVPIISMNGTAPQDLQSDLLNAVHAINDAEKALLTAQPNGRDYQNLSGGIGRALAQHSTRLDALDRIRRELTEMLDHVQTFIEWKEERDAV